MAFSWFATKYGKIFSRACVGGTAFSVFAAYLTTQGPYQDKIQEVCQFYRLGKPKPLSDKVQALINDVLKDCDLKDDEKAKIKFFNVVGQDLSHIGGTNSPWGARVGIPFYFEDSRKINFGALRLQGYETVDWVIEGQPLMEALSLSDNAKKFGIMREIYSCNIWNEIDNAIILGFCIAFPGELARQINIKKDAFNTSKFKNRFVTYIMCFGMGLLLLRLLKDPLKHITSKNSDERAALRGSAYIEGGIEFYEHVLMTNKALRKLLGKSGENKFDIHGNERYFLFAPKLPTCNRLEHLKKLKLDQNMQA